MKKDQSKTLRIQYTILQNRIWLRVYSTWYRHNPIGDLLSTDFWIYGRNNPSQKNCYKKKITALGHCLSIFLYWIFCFIGNTHPWWIYSLSGTNTLPWGVTLYGFLNLRKICFGERTIFERPFLFTALGHYLSITGIFLYSVLLGTHSHGESTLPGTDKLPWGVYSLYGFFESMEGTILVKKYY